MSNIINRLGLRSRTFLGCSRASWLTLRCSSLPTTFQHKTFQASRASSSTALDSKPTFITTPIFYVNAGILCASFLSWHTDNIIEPHVGHLYTLVLADVYKRWETLNQRPARLLTGTDEHGMKVQQAAAKVGVPAEVFCDELAAVFKVYRSARELVHKLTFLRN
jgi:methionyl-tRNA synthetase